MHTQTMVIDAHSHLWLKQDTTWNGKEIRTTTSGRSIFLGEEVQMLPPFMIDGRNTAEVFLSNMDFAQVSAAVVVQEFIDGIQNDYLADVQQRFPDRFLVCGMCNYFQPGFSEEVQLLLDKGFKGIAVPGHRLITDCQRIRLNSDEMMRMFHSMEQRDIVLSMTLADGDIQVGEIREVIEECPKLRIAIGHFGMPTRDNWIAQVKLARYANVMLESGGITWLYNAEFYPYKGAIRAIREAADTVGIEKLMWGSDYPRTISVITYRMSYDFVLRSEELSMHEKELFLGVNAQRFYGFGNMPQMPYVKHMAE